MKATLAFCLLTPLTLFSAAGCESSSPTTNPIDMAAPQDFATTTADLANAPDLNQPADMASVVPPTEVMVLRLGDGAATLAANTAAAVFLERHKIADGALVGAPVALPTAVSGKNRPFTLAGTAVSEGSLSRSVDGRYVLLAGYDAVPGAASVVDNTNRVVGRVAADGSVDTSTSFDLLNGTGNNIRGATSTDGTALWVSGVTGIGYTTLGSTAAPVRLMGDPFNMRALAIFDGQLYASRASDTTGGINTIGTGLPMTANVTAKQLTGFPSTNNTLSPLGFVAFDRDATPGIDTLYVADDRTGTGGGVQRWKLAGATWSLDGTLLTGATAGARGVAGFVSGANIVLVVTTAEAAGTQPRLVTFTDNGGAAASLTATTIATAAAKTTYRGVCLAPM